MPATATSAPCKTITSRDVSARRKNPLARRAGKGETDPNVFQIIFNEISAAEISQLPTLTQLELLDQFKVSPEDIEKVQKGEGDTDRFGHIERDGITLYRFRASDLRIYFEIADEGVVVHRVLNKNTFQDFLYRAELPLAEDEALKESKTFWKLIEEGQNARRS